MIRRTDGSASGPEEDTVAMARWCRFEKSFSDISTMFASHVDTCQYQMTERATLQHYRSVFVLFQSSAAHALILHLLCTHEWQGHKVGHYSITIQKTTNLYTIAYMSGPTFPCEFMPPWGHLPIAHKQIMSSPLAILCKATFGVSATCTWECSTQAFQISVKFTMCLGLWVLLQWSTRHLEEGSSECEEYPLHRGNSVP